MESITDLLSSASARGELEKVLSLLQAGVDVNGKNKFGRTALQVAMLGKTNLVTALLEAGAEPNVRDDVLKLTVVHDAARDGFLEAVRALADHGADVNLTDEIGNLPLHLAAKEGQLEVVKLLLELTEDPRRPNDQGRTALQLARDFHHEKTADFIEQYLLSCE